MKIMTRRASLATLLSGIASIGLAGTRGARAQFTEQEVRNGAQVTSTGNVDIDQAASGDQSVVILDDGTQVTGDGVYRTGTSQTVVNGSQVTSTGNVRLTQSASGNQEVATLPSVYYDGVPAGQCSIGAVISDPDGVLYFQRADCCWYKVPCCVANKRKCNGDRCS